MLKPLLLLLVIVMLIALFLNFDFFSSSTSIKKSPIKSIKTIQINSPTKENPIVINEVQTVKDENNLTKELQELLKVAKKLLNKYKEAEALLIYEEVINKSKNSNDIDILKLFVKACFNKASIHYSYPNYDPDSAIESYELIVNNLKNRYSKELLISYMQARIQQSQLISKDEILLAYDELIEKFQADKEERFKKEIEELLFTKSLALMGIDDDEAMDILDTIIAKYTSRSELPDTVKFSILNNIELSIITSNDTEKYVDLANQYMSDSPNTKPLLAMLNIIKNAQDLEQSEALETWNDEHGEYLFPDWDFSELRKWVNKMEIPESKKRIRKYLDLFEKQKYQNMYQSAATSVPTNPIYSDEATQNRQNKEIIYDEIPAYEPDPYVNDILDTQAEISYPNSYSNEVNH